MTVAYSQAGWAAASPTRAAATETFSDEVLIRRIANGDQLAMRTLFSRHRLAIYRWLLRLVDDEALADDLLSDVFLDVWRKAASFERRSSVSTWLLAIARHKALSARRRRTDVELNAAAPFLGSAIAGARRGHRPHLLPWQVDQGDRRDHRHQRGHGEVAHVLRAQEARAAGRICDVNAYSYAATGIAARVIAHMVIGAAITLSGPQ